MTQKWLLLYLKTGGGHISAAKSIFHYCKKHETDILPVLIDGFEKSPRISTYLTEDLYRLSTNYAKWTFETTYMVNKFPPISYTTKVFCSASSIEYLKTVIQKEKPDKIILFHFFLVMPLQQALHSLKLAIPAITVVTDPFIAHPIWFVNNNTNIIVHSKDVQDYAKTKGKTTQIYPTILKEEFNKPASSKEIEKIRDKYNLTKKTILIFGGGEGLPNANKMAKQLSRFDCQVLVVCGKNKIQQKQLRKAKYDNVQVFGFVDFIYELINAADLIITKGGPASVLEILACKKIPIISSYIWEQEKGNVDFIVNNKLGFYEKDYKKLVSVITDLLKNPHKLDSYQDRVNKFKLDIGTKDIVEFIKNYSVPYKRVPLRIEKVAHNIVANNSNRVNEAVKKVRRKITPSKKRGICNSQ